MAELPTGGTTTRPNDSGIYGQNETEILQSVSNVLMRMRYFRRQLDPRRSLFYRQYVGQRDPRSFPDNVTPRSNTFIPYAFSNVETIVSRVLDAYFSVEDFFETRGRAGRDEPNAEKMQLVMSYMLHKAKFKLRFEELIRNIVIYGHAGIKVDWDWEYDTIVYPKPEFNYVPQMDPMTGQPAIDQNGQPVMGPELDPVSGNPKIIRTVPTPMRIPRMCPKFIPIDIFDLMVDPDGRTVCHLCDKTWAEMKREYEQNNNAYRAEGMKELADRLSMEPNSDAIIIRLAELWDVTNNTWTITTFGEDARDSITWKDLRYGFRAMNYSTYQRKAYGGPNILLFHDKNPYLHQRNPILHTSFIKLPNEIYGMGAIEIISDLNESMNRFVNMIVDNWNVNINKRFAYDVNMDIDHRALNNFNVPGGKVGVSGDPSKAIFPLPQFTPAQGDYLLLDIYKGMIEMTSGVSDFYGKGIGTPQGNRTATGIAQVVGESNYRFKMFIRNLEEDILVPLLEMCAVLVQQYVTDVMELSLTANPPTIPKYPLVNPEELIGNYHFDIVAANYATNKMLKQRNMMALANILEANPYINPLEATKELLLAFDLRDPRLLKTEQQVQMEQQQAMAQQIDMMILETMLNAESKARISQSKPMNYKDERGRPRQVQHEGKIPGAGLTGMIRHFAQAHGSTALGLEGLGGNEPVEG